MSLNDELKLLEEKVLSSLDANIQEKMLIENAKFFSNFLDTKVLQDGIPVPDVFFRDKDLKKINLHDILKEGPVVLSFFRGTWCPYCNLELASLATIHDKIKEKGAQLIAVSPELHKFSENIIKRKNIEYPILSDFGNVAATKFGLVFNLPEEYREIYKQLNIHLNKLNGEDSWTLPVPATFIISKDGVVESRYVNADYTQRMEPEDILSQLDLL